MNELYGEQMQSLTDAQRQAVMWQDGSVLVIAGPGSGKTRVLTTRVARLINESEGKGFRVLALTFTNLAADEMRSRVQTICDEPDRASLGTFHSFCMQMLQQHGSHVGVNPDFTIYSQEADRRDLLRQAFRRAGYPPSDDATLVSHIRLIEKLKGALLSPDEAAASFGDENEGARAAKIYELYDAELQRANALDFSSLILRSYQLVKQFAGVAQTYRRTYKYWLVDEFQDTNRAQYKFLKALAGESFKNVFAVADDDQLIYQWNGASIQQLNTFRADFAPQVIQLPTNYRCPSKIVQLANRLVQFNSNRSEGKLPLQAGKVSGSVPENETVLAAAFDTQQAEADAIAAFIADKPVTQRPEIAVIARTRALLEGAKAALERRGIKGCLAQRRDEFVSPQYRWLNLLLKQAARRQDVRNFELLVGAFNKWRGTNCRADMLLAQAEATGRSLLDEWIFEVCKGERVECHELVAASATLTQDPNSYRPFIERAVEIFATEEQTVDLEEDAAAWKALDRTILRTLGRTTTLDQYLQNLDLESKDPPVPKDAIALMTIHAAKGKEYDIVCLIGLAEDTLPSFQSLRAGPASAEMEEERRNCFVAITRAKEQLVLTYAKTFKGYRKAPSRFFTEMGLTPPA